MTWYGADLATMHTTPVPAANRRPRVGSVSAWPFARRVEPHDIHMLFEHMDERHEQGAVQSVLVKFIGRHVGGRNHHDAALEQLREKPTEDHGVGNIGDMEFIKAE